MGASGSKVAEKIYVQAPTDAETCFIKGMVILGDGRLVLTDFENKSLKLFARNHIDRNHVLTCRIPLESEPLDIAKVSSGEVVVCMVGNSTIQFVSVADTLTPDRIIKTAVPCISVAPCGDRLVVCYRTDDDMYDTAVVMLDRRGRYVNTVWRCPSNPWYARLHPDNNDMYVSHSYDRWRVLMFHSARRLPHEGRRETTEQNRTDGVTRVTLAGKVVGEYSDPDLVWPRGLTVHPDGSVYVCGYVSGNIHHMTADCTKIEVLCKGQLEDPYSICYNHRDNTLYVSEYNTDTVKVFKLHD